MTKPAKKKPSTPKASSDKEVAEATHAMQRHNKRSLRSFATRFLVAFSLILLLVPLGLLILYKFEGVKPISTLMIKEALVGHGAKREWIELEDMSPRIYQSVLMSEDGQFCAHGGVDWSALNQVIDDALEGERTRGASTITMQLVKNLFLWPDRSFIRKGLEIPYAMMAELVLGKRRIMEIYLNIVELDAGVFGVGAASKHYFNISAEKIGPRNSARLAVTLPNPKVRNPANPSRRLRSLANIIQKRARASGAYIGCLKEPA